MRILMASDLFHPFLLGGGETRMYEVARRLAKKHEIHVLTRRFKGLPSYEAHEDVHIHRVFVIGHLFCKIHILSMKICVKPSKKSSINVNFCPFWGFA